MAKLTTSTIYPTLPFAVSEEVLTHVREATQSEAVVVIAYRELQGIAVGGQRVYKDEDTVINLLSAHRGMAKELEQQLRSTLGDAVTDEIIEAVDAVPNHTTDAKGNFTD